MSITISNRTPSTFGNKSVMVFDMVIGTYATSGVALTAANLGMANIDLMMIERKSGYLYEYDHTNAKVIVYAQVASTAAGTLSKPAIATTDGTITVSGAGATGAALWLSTDTATGVLGKVAAGDRAIPAATFGITKPTMALATEIVLTGGTGVVAAALFSQVVNGTALSDTVRAIAIGD